jgi:hypothetical protein
MDDLTQPRYRVSWFNRVGREARVRSSPQTDRDTATTTETVTGNYVAETSSHESKQSTGRKLFRRIRTPKVALNSQGALDTPSQATLSSTTLTTIDKGSRERKLTSSSNDDRGVRVDLWKRAYEELGVDKDSKIWIERYENIVNNLAKDENIPKDSSVEEQMAAVVRTRMKIMTNRQWALQWGSKSLNLRQQVESIVKVVQKASGIGSAIASLDPTHAGIAWTGVCVILPVRSPPFHSFMLAYPQRLRAE